MLLPNTRTERRAAEMTAHAIATTMAMALSLGAIATAAPLPDRSTPSAVVKSFYAYYMQRNWRDHIDDDAKPYFSPALWRLLAAAVREERCTQSAVIDWDPFNGSQVETASYRVGNPVVHGNAARVPVSVMLAMGKGSKSFAGHPVTVAVVRGPSGWQIDDVVDDPGGSLAHNLHLSAARASKDLTPSQRACLKKPL